jgi:hypothetical protein
VTRGIRGRLSMWTIPVVLVWVAISSAAEAQTAAGTEQKSRFTISFRLGDGGRGPAADLEGAMRLAGFDHASIGLFSGAPIATPFSSTGFGSIGFPFSIDWRYRTIGPWVVGIVYSNTPIGTTLGEAENYRFLFIDYGVVTTAGMIGAQWHVIQVSAGPALHILRSKRSDQNAEPIRWVNTRRFGYVAQVRTSVPEYSTVFFDMSAEYRSTGRASVGPFTARGAFGSTTSFPSTNVTYSHWFLGIGAGLRF